MFECCCVYSGFGFAVVPNVNVYCPSKSMINDPTLNLHVRAPSPNRQPYMGGCQY